jgi:iron only hydrogenase large subunit-like protein
MACVRQCPTQAIRIRNGKAVISEELCVDCGTCISACPSGAVVAITDLLADISHFKYKVVVPSPVLYAQFDSSIHPYMIHLAFKKMGFDAVVDVSTSYAALARALYKYIKQAGGRRPQISSHCPSIIRLIQVRYPDLVEQIVPLDVPREVTAREIRKELPRGLGLNPKDIGIVYVAPCPAIIVSIKQPAEKVQSYFDGALSIKEVYSALVPIISEIKEEFSEDQVPEEFSFNSSWTTFGAVTTASALEDWLAVSGLDHVMRIFDDIENSRIRNVHYVEAMTCMLGCVSGAFGVENPYVARTNSIKQQGKYFNLIKANDEYINNRLREGYFDLENPILPRDTKYFDTDLETSIKRMKERERIYQKLRQMDCGCCGAPTCLSFAEDVVRGEAQLTDCIFLAQSRRED